MIRFATLFICTVLLITNYAFASVRITEIAWMGTAESQFGEWIELYNDSAENVSLSGWKLYEGGGDQLVFTLTKTISSEGYLLVERTTASSPDPVPGINDESGPFSGSGFANTGEYLVLKNSVGTIEQSLDFSSGWPAGDATTKQTMQWDGSKWITTNPTPKSATPKGAEDTPGDPPKNNTGVAWSAPKSEPHIEISIPKNVYIKVSAEYSAKTFLEFGQAYEGLFLWNMGDGTVYKSNKNEIINHTYNYPGLYTISFAYFRAPYEKKPFLYSSIEKTVINNQISFRVISEKGFEFTNSDVVPIDISGWFIELPDNKLIELPAFTIIASKKSVLMPFSSFGISDNKYTNAVLQTSQRVDIVNSVVQEKNNTEVKSSSQVSAPKVLGIYNENTLEDQNVLNIQDFKIEPEKNKNPQSKKLIFGGVLLVVIILFILMEKKVEQEP
ncbi:MAG: lamin tail domain-containing protein [Candidatus Pacebacteria bacterium]|nr:lamin tail domain-containing protein [Candidatus Paceibacterota bacterium]